MDKRERESISVFLYDLYHHKQVMRRMKEVAAEFSRDEILAIISELRSKEVIDEEEEEYLRKRLNALYDKVL